MISKYGWMVLLECCAILSDRTQFMVLFWVTLDSSVVEWAGLVCVGVMEAELITVRLAVMRRTQLAHRMSLLQTSVCMCDVVVVERCVYEHKRHNYKRDVSLCVFHMVSVCASVYLCVSQIYIWVLKRPALIGLPLCCSHPIPVHGLCDMEWKICAACQYFTKTSFSEVI